jgi:hypothetical protein
MKGEAGMARVNPLYSWRGSVAKSDLPSTSRLVAFALLIWVNEGTVSAWPSQKSLASACGLTERSVREHLGVLEEHGWLVCKKREGKTDIWTLSDPSMTPEPAAGVSEPTPEPASKTPERGSAELSRTEDLTPSEEAKASSSAQRLVTFFIDYKGSRPPNRVVGQVGKEVKALLEEGFPPGIIETALRNLADKRLHPSVLPSLVDEAQNPRKPAVRKTGWRFVRGSHGGTYIEDPNGTDRLPAGYTGVAA